MSQKQTKIDPTRGNRFKLILSMERCTNEKIAEALDCTPEHVSYMLNGKRTLTEQKAKKIIELFPKYRIEWLLGFDDYPTEGDVSEAIQRVEALHQEARSAFLAHVSASAGFSCFLKEGSEDQYEIRPLCGDVVLAKCPSQDLTALLDDLEEYAKFKLCMLIEKRATKEMEDIINGNH